METAAVTHKKNRRGGRRWNRKAKNSRAEQLAEIEQTDALTTATVEPTPVWSYRAHREKNAITRWSYAEEEKMKRELEAREKREEMFRAWEAEENSQFLMRRTLEEEMEEFMKKLVIKCEKEENQRIAEFEASSSPMSPSSCSSAPQSPKCLSGEPSLYSSIVKKTTPIQK